MSSSNSFSGQNEKKELYNEKKLGRLINGTPIVKLKCRQLSENSQFPSYLINLPPIIIDEIAWNQRVKGKQLSTGTGKYRFMNRNSLIMPEPEPP